MKTETPRTHTEAFDKLYRTVQTLRAPGGCPWDREQTPRSLRGDLLEEAYECVEAIDSGDPAHIQEELGDVFLLATMLSYMHEQEGHFTVADTLSGISEKLIRRHPHVFGESDASTPDEVIQQWNKIKVEQEGRAPKESLMDEVSRSLPPLERAWKLQKKAAKAGFDWPSIDGVLDKLEEELLEVKEELAAVKKDASDSAKERLENELGDLLFSVINLCRSQKVDPSIALQKTNAKFVRRFKHVEAKMKAENRPMTPEDLTYMDSLWDEAKKAERT